MTLLDGAASPASDLVKDGTDKSFMADVIEPSKQTPVIVDFWAPWCGPCKTLAPALERAVRAAKGKVKLVKINIDENPGVAGQLGVRSIPAVFAFDQGRPVDGFMGAVPESQIKLFVDKLGGDDGEAADIEALLEAAKEALAQNDIGGAAEAYAAVLQLDEHNVKAIAGMARAYLAAGDPEQAQQVLSIAPNDKANDPDILGVRAALDLAAQAGDASEAVELAKKVQADPKDFQARFDLANALAARNDLEGAVDHLLAIVEADRTWNDEAARKQLVKIFEAAGFMSDIAKSGRRRLSGLLFS